MRLVSRLPDGRRPNNASCFSHDVPVHLQKESEDLNSLMAGKKEQDDVCVSLERINSFLKEKNTHVLWQWSFDVGCPLVVLHCTTLRR